MRLSRQDIHTLPPAMRSAVMRQLGSVAPKPAAVVQSSGMNGLEAQYARRLDELKLAGEIRFWCFNYIRLCIADGAKKAWFKCDFFIQFSDGHWEAHETKGHRREAAILRLKVAAGLYPFRFVLVTRVAGAWRFEEYGA